MARNIKVSSSDWIDLRTRGYTSGMYLLNAVGAAIEYSTAATPVPGTTLVGSSAVLISGTYLWVRGYGDCELYTASEWAVANPKIAPVMASTSSSGELGFSPPIPGIPSMFGLPKLMIFGCSIAQQCNAYLHSTSSSTTSEVKAGNNVIPVANGAVFTVGQKITLPLYNARLWSTTITAINGNSLTLADNLPGLVRTSSIVGITTTPTVPPLDLGYGAANAAAALLGNPVEVVPAWGYGGAIAIQMIQDLERDLRYYRPHYCALHLFENDLTRTVASGGATIDQLKGFARYAARMCLRYGAIPLVYSSMPYYNCVNGNGIPASRTADYDELSAYIGSGTSGQLAKDVPGAWGDNSVSWGWTDPDFMIDAAFARRPIYAKMLGGTLTTGEQALSNWTSITSGGFVSRIDGTVRTITGLNFSAVTSMADVAAVIKTGLGNNALFSWDAAASAFVFRAPATIEAMTAPGSGTDISAQLKMVSGAYASLTPGWTDGVHPNNSYRFGAGKVAMPVQKALFPPAQSFVDMVVSPTRQTLLAGSTGGTATNLIAGSVVPTAYTISASGASTCKTSRNSDGSLKIYGAWPAAASFNSDYLIGFYTHTFQTVWPGSTARCKCYMRIRINSMMGISNIGVKATLNTGEDHISLGAAGMCDTVPADGSIIVLETPVFAIGANALNVKPTFIIRPNTAASPANAVLDMDIIELGMIPCMPEVPHSYV